MLVDSKIIKQNGWKQGACLLVNTSVEIYTTTKCMKEQLPEGLYFVLSQDCDILNQNLEKEPVIELIKASKIPQRDHRLTSGKNPRQLHIILNQGNSCLEFLPHNRLFIARTYLKTQCADQVEIIDQQLDMLINWITKRYRRHGFPDAFNSRCKPIMEGIKQILSNEAKKIRGIFIRLNTRKELEANEKYKLIIKMLVPKEFYEDKQGLSAIHDGFDKILRLFDSINGIEILAGSQVQSMDEITLHGYQELREWDFDYISFLNNEGGETTNNVVL